MLARCLLFVQVVLLVACGSSAPAAPEETTEPALTATTPPAPSTPRDTPAPAPTGVPLPETPKGTWTWIGPEAFDNQIRCMDGSTSGIAINRSPSGSTKVLFYMQGGAACWDGTTCALAEDILSSGHANEKDFEAWVKRQGNANVMNRDRAENPFRDWNHVMIPYCSGDVFAGDAEKGFRDRPQVGFKNVAALLPRVAATFKDAERVVLSGMSAGGYGAVWNFPQFQKAFSWTDVVSLNDSGPIMSTRFTPSCLQDKWKATWGMDRTQPVPGTFDGLAGVFHAMLDAYPKNKFLFLSSRSDLVMRYFHGIGHTASCAGVGFLSAATFEQGLADIRTVTSPNFSTFYGPGTGHPYFLQDAPMYDTVVDGVSMAAWIGRAIGAGDEPKRIPAQL